MREEEEEEEDGYPEGEEEESDEDAEAAEIARRLSDKLMADIAKAQAEQAAAAAAVQTQEPVVPATSAGTTSDPTAAAITTMKSILAHATKDPLVNFVLASASVIDPNGNKVNALQILQRSIEAGSIHWNLAKTFSPVVLQLSQSKTLFDLEDATAASTPVPEIGKRKRDDPEDHAPSTDVSGGQKTAEVQDILSHITPAVRAISNALSAGELPSQDNSDSTPLNPALISSVQVPLHQIFLFAVTTAPSVAQPQGGALQEIGGLIQMLGVLSGIHIGPNLQQPQSLEATHDLSTAVYPCLSPACHKTFSRLYSLRSHQRNHSAHPTARPYQCPHCPASFARNHDLKRHAKLHGSKAFKCSGCDKIFSRRDAIKRHMNSSRLKTESSRPPSSNIVLGRREEAERCRDAEVIEVEVAREGGFDEAKEEKRAKSWGDKLASAAQDEPSGSSSGGSSFEEGEIPLCNVAEAQRLVLDLFPLLSRYVANYVPRASEPVPGTDPTRTVASLMAGQSWSQGLTETGTRSAPATDPGLSSLSLSWLSPEQTKQLEDAIAAAAKSAQEQAEAEAALEEEDEEGEDEDMEEVEPMV